MAKKRFDWRQALVSGVPRHEIAERAGVSLERVSQEARKLGVQEIILTLDDVVALLKSGMSRHRVAKLRGTSPQAVYQFCKRKGIKS